MKNLREIPKQVNFENILKNIHDLNHTIDITSILSDTINITFPVSKIDNIYNKSICNRFVPFQYDLTYKEFYQYYNYEDIDISAESNIVNNYPIES
jgi:hypothetical protein